MENNKIREEAESFFNKAKKTIPKNRNMILLHIGEENTFMVKEDSEPPVFMVFPLGSTAIGERFKDAFPAKAEAERAISEIKEAIAPFYEKVRDKNYQLATLDLKAREIAGYAYAGNKYFRDSELEGVFGRFEAIIGGKPLSSDILPEDRQALCYTFILREILHYMEFDNIILL